MHLYSLLKNWLTCCTAGEIFGHQTGTQHNFLALCAPPMENLLTLWPEIPTPTVPLNKHYFYKLKCTGSDSYTYSLNLDAVPFANCQEKTKIFSKYGTGTVCNRFYLFSFRIVLTFTVYVQCTSGTLPLSIMYSPKYFQ